jgi:glycosyltransferase involved in cell wall biosynthesis
MALASAVDRLIADRDYASRLISHASRVFLDRFTLERSAERMATLYRELVK